MSKAVSLPGQFMPRVGWPRAGGEDTSSCAGPGPAKGKLRLCPRPWPFRSCACVHVSDASEGCVSGVELGVCVCGLSMTFSFYSLQFYL